MKKKQKKITKSEVNKKRERKRKKMRAIKGM
jgi:hypothetical protein